MWDGFNKRKFPRLGLQCEILVHPESQTEPVATITENLGIGGVCVILDHHLDRFAACRIRLQITPDLPKVECGGRVVWSVPTRVAKSRKAAFDTGLEFVDIDPRLKEKIRVFIEAEIKRDPALLL